MQLNQFVRDTAFSPITEAVSWLDGRHFPDDMPLLDVSQAIPGYPTSALLLQHISEVLHQPDTSRYGDVLGMATLRAAYAAKLNNGGTGCVQSCEVAITSGCNQAFYVAIAALCAAGDQVILPTPHYFNHKMTLDSLGVECIDLPGDADNRMLPDIEHAISLINTKTRAIALTSPNNPTGEVYPASVINAFYELCQSNNIALIIDETYRDFRQKYTTAPHSLFNNPDWSETLVHLYSFSKAYALAGYRVGALVGSETLQREATKILDCVAICAPQVSQHAALFGLQHGDEWLNDKRRLMESRATAFREAMNESDNGYRIAAIGTYFAYIQHPFENVSAWKLAQTLADKANLLALPGEMFGKNQSRYMRFAFANIDSDKMTQIANRLAKHHP